MKNMAKLSLTLLSVSILSACNSGGGDKDYVPPITGVSNVGEISSTNQVIQSTTQSTSNTSSNNINTPSTTTGKVLTLWDANDRFYAESKSLTDSNLNSISIDNELIYTQYPNSIGNYQFVRFGSMESRVNDDKEYLFYNGNPTKEMPLQGSATYQGEVIFTEEHPVIDIPDRAIGTSKFDVNFAENTVNGELNIGYLEPITIQAKIVDENFAGTAKSNQLGDAKLEGKFFGENATELGGIFTNDTSWGGAFGAKK